MVKKSVFYILFFALFSVSNIWAQIGSIPPKGPSIIGEEENLTIEEMVDIFLIDIHKRRAMCDTTYLSWKDDVKSFKMLYLQQVVMDSVYLANHISPVSCEEAGPTFFNHHPTLECMFKNSKVQESFNKVINHESFHTYFRNSVTDEQYKQFLNFYHMLFTDIELKKSMGKLTND